MELYLSKALADNRKGRFLQSIIGAKSLSQNGFSSLPARGLLLLQAQELVDGQSAKQLYHWAMQSACAALIIEPKETSLALLQSLPNTIDWQLTSKCSFTQGTGFASLLYDEINQSIVGFAGRADPSHHQIDDFVHTRYIRKHSNSGLLAVTTLPLWSLSLLDHGEALVCWLQWFVEHSGTAADNIEQENKGQDYIPEKEDLLVLLLLYAASGMPLQTVLELQPVKAIFNLDTARMIKRSEHLKQYGYVDKNGVTDRGEDCLKASQYWVYQSLLTDQLAGGLPKT